MATRKSTTKQPERPPLNLIPVVAIVALVVLAVVDLLQVNADVPNFIYFGLIGAALGAKFTDVANYFGGGKR